MLRRRVQLHRPAGHMYIRPKGRLRSNKPEIDTTVISGPLAKADLIPAIPRRLPRARNNRRVEQPVGPPAVRPLVRLAAPLRETQGLVPLPERQGVECLALSAAAAKGIKLSKSRNRHKRGTRAVWSHTIERLELACKDAATRSIEVPVVR